MELQHINVKLILSNPAEVNLAALIPVFNRWMQDQAAGDLLLDIADYRHVPAGPGVILIGNEADTSVDNTDERLGVRYNRKAAVDGDNQERLKQAAQAALSACQRLEAEPLFEGKLRFGGRELEIFINDRLLAPNRDATRAALRPDLETFSRKLFRGSEWSLSYGGDARRLFTVSLLASRSFTVAELLSNLNS